MKRPTLEDLIRLAEGETAPAVGPLSEAAAPDGVPGESDRTDWERIEHLRRLWAVADPKPRGERRSHRRLLGLPVRAAKAIFRLLAQPFINETLDRQTTFNEHAAALLESERGGLLALRLRIDLLAEGIAEGIEERDRAFTALAARADGAERRLEELRAEGARVDSDLREKERAIRALEEAVRSEVRIGREFEDAHRQLVEDLRSLAAEKGGAIAGPAAEAAGRTFDYARFHGAASPEETTHTLYSFYMKYFEGRRLVVDLGCGRGVLLRLLAERGVPAYGVERDARLLEHCRAAGYDVRGEDVIEHLERMESAAVDGIFAGHLVEHLPYAGLIRLLRLAALRLAPGGILVFESPNTTSLLVLSHSYFRDPTHRMPLHPETYRFLAESCGFESVELEYTYPAPEEHRLRLLPDDGVLPKGAVEILNRNTEKLNELLHGYANFAVIARRSGGAS
jgi:SAM-dependent methyltransferase